MASSMVNVYADLIMKGKKTIDQVPQKLRQDVIDELIRRGFWPAPNDQNEE